MAQSSQKYSFAAVAADIVVFTIAQGKLKSLLIQMKKAPYTNIWAFPGGLVQPTEAIEVAAQRILKAKTGLGGLYLEQLFTFGKVNRDPLGRVVSVAYFGLLPYEKGLAIKTTSEYGGIAWVSVKKFPRLAYDHDEIAQVALRRLATKIEYTNIARWLLPVEFTLAELQEVYEIILDRKLDKRNFRKKIMAVKTLKRLRKLRKGLKSRPAELYSFSGKGVAEFPMV